MKKKLLASIFAALVINLVCIGSVSAHPGSDADKAAQLAAKVKAAILKLGTGPQARVELKLREGTRLKGYLAEVGEDYFVVVDENGGASRQIPFPQVKQVKGSKLSHGVWAAITVGALVGIGFLVAVAAQGR